MTTPIYDFSDPAVATMVLLGHKPQEIWTATADGKPALLQFIQCVVDHEPWKCSTMVSYEDFLNTVVPVPPEPVPVPPVPLPPDIGIGIASPGGLG
jgi:hypothetical protein